MKTTCEVLSKKRVVGISVKAMRQHSYIYQVRIPRDQVNLPQLCEVWKTAAKTCAVFIRISLSIETGKPLSGALRPGARVIDTLNLIIVGVFIAADTSLADASSFLRWQ